MMKPGEGNDNWENPVFYIEAHCATEVCHYRKLSISSFLAYLP